MYKTKICNFLSTAIAAISAIVIFILINTGILAVAAFTTPLIIITAISAFLVTVLLFIISLFNIFTNHKENYCFCKNTKLIIFSSIITIILALIILFSITLLGTLSGAILIGLALGSFVLTLFSIICFVICLTQNLCKKECMCYNYCPTIDNQ